MLNFTEIGQELFEIIDIKKTRIHVFIRTYFLPSHYFNIFFMKLIAYNINIGKVIPEKHSKRHDSKIKKMSL